MKLKIIIGVSISVLVIVLVVGGFRNYQQNHLKQQRISQLVQQAKERSSKTSNDKVNVSTKKEVSSSLNSTDLDLKKRFNRDDVVSQAKIILGIISDDTRMKAMKDLPLTTEASEKYFGSSNKVFYGKYTDDVSVNVVFAGLDYSGSDSNYSANVIADVTHYGKNGESDNETVSLVIHYNGTEISSWNY